MKFFKILTLLLSVFGLLGCGGHRAVKPEPTPVVVATIATPRAQVAPKKDYRRLHPKNVVVVRGDSLWKISGKTAVYGDSFQWPLLWRANREFIQSPDLIEPGQVLRVPASNYFSKEKARKKAKAWPPYKPTRRTA